MKRNSDNRKQQCPHFRVLPFCIRCCPSGWYTTPPQDFFTTPGLFSHLANEKAETQAAEFAQVTEWTSDKDRIWTPDRQASIPVLGPLSTQLSDYTMCLGRQEVSRNTGFFFFFFEYHMRKRLKAAACCLSYSRNSVKKKKKILYHYLTSQKMYGVAG